MKNLVYWHLKISQNFNPIGEYYSYFGRCLISRGNQRSEFDCWQAFSLSQRAVRRAPCAVRLAPCRTTTWHFRCLWHDLNIKSLVTITKTFQTKKEVPASVLWFRRSVDGDSTILFLGDSSPVPARFQRPSRAVQQMRVADAAERMHLAGPLIRPTARPLIPRGNTDRRGRQARCCNQPVSCPG